MPSIIHELAFVSLEIDEIGNIKVCFHKILKTLKHRDEVGFLCV